jgi:uncharacterized Zn-binding protein involved in type VI secretion
MTLNIPNYTGNLILLPFISSYQNGSLGFYDPSHVKYITNPDYVGYFAVSLISGSSSQPLPINPESFNHLVVLSSNRIYQVSGEVYVVPNGASINITTVANSTTIPVIWVMVDIGGQYYRISYPQLYNPESGLLFSGTGSVSNSPGSGSSPSSSNPPVYSTEIYTEEGKVTLPVNYISYYEYLKQLIPSYSQIYYLNGTQIAIFNDHSILNASSSNVAFVSGSKSATTVIFSGNAMVIAEHMGVSKSIKLIPIGNVNLPPIVNTGLPPYIPLSVIESPIQDLLKGQSWITNNDPNVCFNSNQNNYEIDAPTVFEGSVTFKGNSNVNFNAPVVFEGSVTFKGNSNIVSSQGMIFNGTQSIVTFEGNTHNTLGGPVIFNTSKLIFDRNSFVTVQGPVAVASSSIIFNKNSNLTSYQYSIFYNVPILNGNGYIGTINKVPPVNINIKVPQSLFYTEDGSLDSVQAWFQPIPNYNGMTVLNYTLSNSSSFSYLTVALYPSGLSSSQLNLQISLTNASGTYVLSTFNSIQAYSWYFVNITLVYPTKVEMQLYSQQSQLMLNIQKYTVLPTNSLVSACIGNESFTQLFLLSSELSNNQNPTFILNNGYLTDNSKQLSSVDWGNSIVLYYYLVSSYQLSSSATQIPPSFANPSPYYSYYLKVDQTMVGYQT